MNIRPAVIEDIIGLARVHVASWRDCYRGIMPDLVLDTLSVDRFAERWIGYLQPPTSATFVCEIEGRIVGFSHAGPTREADCNPATIGEIYAIYLDSSVWNHGLGRELIKHAMEFLSTEGYQEVMLRVIQENHRARRFYERAGFLCEEGSTEILEIGGMSIPEVRYRRLIDGDLGPDREVAKT